MEVKNEKMEDEDMSIKQKIIVDQENFTLI